MRRWLRATNDDPCHDERVASILGIALGICFTTCFVTGLYSPEYAEFIEHHPAGLDRGTVSGRVLLDRKIVHVPDVLADPEYTYRTGQKIGGYRTVLGVPLMREGTPIGVMAMNRLGVRPFSDKHIELLTTFADQAVVCD